MDRLYNSCLILVLNESNGGLAIGLATVVSCCINCYTSANKILYAFEMSFEWHWKYYRDNRWLYE
jgi:hypothetical protein